MADGQSPATILHKNFGILVMIIRAKKVIGQSRCCARGASVKCRQLGYAAPSQHRNQQSTL